jgi:hypothetical protein
VGHVMIDPGLYRLKQVDYSQRGHVIHAIVDGIAKPQTVIFSTTDCFNEKCYFSEEGLRYIIDSRTARREQRFVLDHLDKIVTSLKSPVIVGKNRDVMENYLYFKPLAIAEHQYKKLLFVVVLKKSNFNIVWNFYYLKSGKIPEATEVFYKTKEAKKFLR